MTSSTPTTSTPAARTSAGDLHALHGAGAAPVLLDVRSPAEFEAEHVPGAVNVPLDVLRASAPEVARLLDGRDCVLVCRSGQRAGQAQEALRTAGVSLPLLEGGMTAWTAVGGPVRRGRQVWQLERQVRLVAGGLVLAFVLASLLVPAAKWLAAGVGFGLVFAALSDTCAMGNLLARMPWNRRSTGPEPLVALRSAVAA